MAITTAQRKRITVVLSDEEIQFIEWMQKERFYGTNSLQETMQRMFYLQLREDMDYCGAEFRKGDQQ